MSLFIPTIPTSGQNLDFSQGQLLNNNAGLDTVFGVDHYKFSDATANKGFHNKVTTPQFYLNSTIPPVYPTVSPITTSNPIFYAFQPTDGSGTPTTNLGLLQYSKGTSNAVATPVTSIQSAATATVINASSTSAVFDFTGIGGAFCILVAADFVIVNKQIIAYVIFNGTTLNIQTLLSNSLPIGFTATAAGKVLQLNNTSGGAYSNIYWTLQFLRIQ